MDIKKYKLNNSFNYDIEPHEVFLDKMAKEKDDDNGLSEKKLEVPLKERTAYTLLAIFLLMAVVFFSKSFYLQIIQGNKLRVSAESNKGRISLVKAERGIIYDKNLKKLVLNSPAYDFVCDKRLFAESQEIAVKEIEDIAILVNQEKEELKNKIVKSDEPVVIISENISHEMLLVLESKINNFPACQIEKNIARDYVLGLPFSHLLGFTSRVNKEDLTNSKDYSISDYAGKTGIEKSYEEALRGKPGKVELEKTALGVKKGEKIISYPEAGDSLVLNIDYSLQEKIYQELEKSIKNIGSKKGAALAINPKNGAVLALVSYPSYDNNLFSKGISFKDFNEIQNDPYQPLFNRATSAQYPIGSTIKPFEASGALQEKLISPNKLINDPGYILVHSIYDPTVVYTFGGVAPHGLVDMRKAIAVSSNIYFYTIGGGYEDQKGLGPTRIKKYLSLFGFNKKTGIDLPGEFGGFIPDPEWKKQVKKENWWDGDTYNLSIGQSDLQVTPLQVASAYSAIANGGTLYKPQIVHKIIESETSQEKTAKDIKVFEPEILNKNFIDAENLKIIREGMRDAVAKDYGSSYILSDLPVKVAAKTGTVQIPKENHFNTWVSSFAPYENPEIVLVVTIEDVEGLRSATLPVAHEVLKWYFSR